MKKARLYTWTLLGIGLIVLIVGLLTFRYLYLSAQTTFWESKMTNA